MKDANFRKSLSRGFTLSMVLLSLRSLGNPLGPCGFRPFDFYSKLTIENQKFPIVIFNV